MISIRINAVPLLTGGFSNTSSGILLPSVLTFSLSVKY
uniref:Uncharacterized protein n=1 Tax=Xenopus tropicalis TaxID=8364 RepID=A0A6I8SLU1_XENTR